MSRGLGKIQRQLLALLSQAPTTLTGAACAIFCNPRPSRSEYETVRRAFSKLQGLEHFARRGTIARSRVWKAFPHSDSAPKRKAQPTLPMR
jgi:hypothetical protein